MRFLWLSFGRWSYVNTNYDYFGVSKKRIYFNGYKWTPFVVVSIHRISKSQGEEINVL